MQHVGPLIFIAACEIQFPDQGLNACPLHRECRVLTTGPPGNKTPLGELHGSRDTFRGCEQRNSLGFYISSFKKLLLLSSSCLTGLGREGSWCLFNSWLIASAHFNSDAFACEKYLSSAPKSKLTRREAPLFEAAEDIAYKK